MSVVSYIFSYQSFYFKIMKRLKEWTVRKLSWTPFFKVDESFFWIIDYEDKDWYRIIAEKGFVTNFWSIPRLFRVFFDPTKYNSYVIHDVCYQEQVKYHKKYKEMELLTRKEADMILLEGLAYEWASTIEKFCIYFGVRLFWWIAWLQN
jgi:hypothetical protein